VIAAMSKHCTRFEATEGGLALSGAILLYRNEGLGAASAAFASVHPITHQDDGAPVVGAGAPLTRAHLRKWTAALGRTAPPEILPDNILVAHPDMLAWWVPAQVRSGYFALSATKGLKALAARVVLPVPYPPHVFVATRKGFGVYALRESRRPGADTPVLHSPILNVYLGGQLCWGNIARPKSLSIASIPAFEAAVFDSWSTHPNPGQEATVTGKGGLVRLWDDLAACSAKSFPVARLKPFAAHTRRGHGDPKIDGALVTVGMLVAAGGGR
jgi:PRTRC genetic system protein B